MEYATFQRVQESLRRVQESLRDFEDASRVQLAVIEAAARESRSGQEHRDLHQQEDALKGQIVGLIEATMLVMEEIQEVSRQYRSGLTQRPAPST